MEYKDIVTPKDSHKLKLKAWLTGRDSRAIDAILAQNVEVDASGGGKKVTLAPNALILQSDKSIELVVEEMNGSKDDILNRVLDMHRVDYEYALGEIEKIVQGTEEEVKKN